MWLLNPAFTGFCVKLASNITAREAGNHGQKIHPQDIAPPHPTRSGAGILPGLKHVITHNFAILDDLKL